MNGTPTPNPASIQHPPDEDATSPARSGRSAILGAMFLMATSAIGPGFIVQTTNFTAQLGAAFAFAILVSILVDIAVQLNVWRVIGVSGQRAHELADAVVPGGGYALAALVVLGGVVFNIGNIAGTGLGTDALMGLDPKIGGALSALLAIGIFLIKRAGAALDRIVVVLGLLMIALTAYVAATTGPPVGQALKNMVLPEKVDVLVITTLIGGTVGGYITYAGAHRLLDSGMTGRDHVRQISRSSVTGILVTGVMRTLLFLAVFGVVAGGAVLDKANPPASAFLQGAGELGLRLFGMVLWAAAITSVIGASYTSVSFITRSSTPERVRNRWTVGFILVCLLGYLTLGKAPDQLLIFAGAFNGVILPFGFAVLLWVAWRRRDLLHGYVYPRWLLAIGGASWLLTVYLGVQSLSGLAKLWG